MSDEFILPHFAFDVNISNVTPLRRLGPKGMSKKELQLDSAKCWAERWALKKEDHANFENYTMKKSKQFRNGQAEFKVVALK